MLIKRHLQGQEKDLAGRSNKFNIILLNHLKLLNNLNNFKPLNHFKRLNNVKPLNNQRHETNNQPDSRTKSRIAHQMLGVHTSNGLSQTC